MSFLDNLENNLKALESRDQGGIEDNRRREEDRERAIASAPWAEELKNGPFAQALIQQAVRAGHQRRTKVHLAWIGTTLRLEARSQRLELQPSPAGVEAVFPDGGRQIVDLSDKPDQIVQIWMELVDKAAIS